MKRKPQFMSILTITFNDVLQNDKEAIYHMYFTTNPSGDFNTKDAVTVNDRYGIPIKGRIGGFKSIIKEFDFDHNTQGGRKPGTDAYITIVTIGLNTARYSARTGTITRTKSLLFSLSSVLETDYAQQEYRPQ